MSWLTWPVRLLWFLVWFAQELLMSNLKVVRDNLTPGQDCTPGVAVFRTRCRTDTELTCLAALITLTPGTLTLGTGPRDDASPDRVLYVHGMYNADADSLRADLQTMETRMLHALRREGVTS